MDIRRYNVPKEETTGTKVVGNSSNLSSGSEFEPHYLWGQYFDDTKDIDGTIKTVGDVIADGNISGDTMYSTHAYLTNLYANYIKTNQLELDALYARLAEIATIRASGITSENITNNDTITTKNLNVLGSAHFIELIIDKIKAAGGAIILSPADGFKVAKVSNTVAGYKMYWVSKDDNGKAITNMWLAGDQAICQSFNQATIGVSHNINNKYFWALVLDAGVENIDGYTYNYIEISKTDCDGTVTPEVGDEIAMLGNRTDTSRQTAIYLSAYNSIDPELKAPLFAQYVGINDYSIAKHRKTYIDAKGASFIGNFKVSSGQDLEDFINGQVSGTTTDLHTYYAYSTSEDGSENFSITPFEGYAYTGVQVTSAAEQSLNYMDYVWSERSQTEFYQLMFDQAYAFVSNVDNKLTVHGEGKLIHFRQGSLIPVNSIDVSTYSIKVINNLADSPIRRFNFDDEGNFNFTFYTENWYSLENKEGSYRFQLVETTGDKVVYQHTENISMNAEAILDIRQETDNQIASITARVTSVEKGYSELNMNYSGISASVYDNIAGDLKRTGIDIKSGEIILNAEQTTVNGDFALFAKDDADCVRLYDDTNIETVNITSGNIGALSEQSQDSTRNHGRYVNLEPNDPLDYIVDGEYYAKDTKVYLSDNWSAYFLAYYYNTSGKYPTPDKVFEMTTAKCKVTIYNVVDETKKYTWELTRKESYDINCYFKDETNTPYTIEESGNYNFKIEITVGGSRVNNSGKQIRTSINVYTKALATGKTLIAADGMYSTGGERKFFYYGIDGLRVEHESSSIGCFYSPSDPNLYTNIGHTGAAHKVYVSLTNSSGSTVWTNAQNYSNTWYVYGDDNGKVNKIPSSVDVIIVDQMKSYYKNDPYTAAEISPCIIDLSECEFEGNIITVRNLTRYQGYLSVNVKANPNTVFMYTQYDDKNGYNNYSPKDKDGNSRNYMNFAYPYFRLMYTMFGTKQSPVDENKKGGWVLLDYVRGYYYEYIDESGS